MKTNQNVVSATQTSPCFVPAPSLCLEDLLTFFFFFLPFLIFSWRSQNALDISKHREILKTVLGVVEEAISDGYHTTYGFQESPVVQGPPRQNGGSIPRHTNPQKQLQWGQRGPESTAALYRNIPMTMDWRAPPHTSIHKSRSKMWGQSQDLL